MKILILYSGGLDSYIMKQLADKNYPNAIKQYVWFDIGQEYNQKEMAVLPEFVDIKKIDWLKKDQKLISKDGSFSGNIIIPGRNVVLATLAASMYLPDEIWMGALCGEIHDKSTDKNLQFLNKINNMFEYVYSPFGVTPKLVFPLVNEGWGKFEAVKYALDIGCSPEDLKKTSSCLSGVSGNCGECVVCCRRWGIFGQLGIQEKYNTHPMLVIDNLKMVIEMLRWDLEGESHYDEFRRREIIPYVKHYFNIFDSVELTNFIKRKFNV